MMQKPRLDVKMTASNLFFVFCTFLGIVITFFYSSHFSIDLFFDRDLIRIARPDREFWIHGPELYGGGRTPGFLYNTLLLTLYNLSFRSIPIFYYCYFFLLITSFFYFNSKFFLNKNEKMISSFIFFNLYFIFEVFLAPWNPSFGMIFVFFAYGLMFQFINSSKEKYFIYLAICISIAINCHLSNLVLIPFFLFFLFYKKIKIRKTMFWLGLFILCAPQIPFLIEHITERADKNFFEKVNINFMSLSTFMDQFFTLLANYFGLIIFDLTSSYHSGYQYTYRALFDDFEYPIITRLLLCTCSILPFAIGFLSIKKSLFSKDHFFLFFLGLVFSVGVLFFSFNDNQMHYRRFLWFFPVCLMVYTSLIKVAMRYHSKVVLVSLVLFFITQNFYRRHNLTRIVSTKEYQFKKEMISYLESKEFTFDEIKRKVGLVSQVGANLERQGEQFQFEIKSETGERDGIEIFYNTSSRKGQRERIDKPCILIIPDKQEFNQLETIKYMPNLDILNRSYKNGINYIEYSAIHDNCITYFKNMYDNAEKKKIIEGEKNTFIYTWKGFRYFFSISLKQYNKQKTLLSLYFVPEQIDTDIQRFMNHDAHIKLTSKNGQVISIPVFPVTSINPMIFVPPIFMDITNVSPGTYSVFIELFDSIVKERFSLDLGEVKLFSLEKE